MCLLLKLFLQLTFNLHSLALHDLFCDFLWACRSCGLVVPWDHRPDVPWECRFASHGHRVVFHFLDSGEKPMAMKNSDTVLPTCRNPGTLDMADTTDAGTDVPSRGLKRLCSGVSGCPYVGRIGEAKGRGVLAKGLPVSEEQIMSSLLLRSMAQGC